MEEHPIEKIMTTAMSSIKEIIDVNTIIGQPIETSNGVVIIPISKVSLGFAAGGSEFKGEALDEYSRKDKEEQAQYRLPFGGGSAAGVTINPVAFLIIEQDGVKLLPADHENCIDRLLDYVPDFMEKATKMIDKICNKQKSNTQNNSADVKTNINTNTNYNNQNKVQNNNEYEQEIPVESDGEIFDDDI